MFLFLLGEMKLISAGFFTLDFKKSCELIKSLTAFV